MGLACMFQLCFSVDMNESSSSRALGQSGCWEAPHSIPVVPAASVELETDCIFNLFSNFPIIKTKLLLLVNSLNNFEY